MTDFTIRNKFAKAVHLRGADRHDHEGVRLYKQSPFNALLQIWSQTNSQAIVSNCSLDADECRRLAAELELLAAELKAYPLPAS